MNKELLIRLEHFLNQESLYLNSTSYYFISKITWKTILPLRCLKCGNYFSISTKQLLDPFPSRDGEICPRCNSEERFKKKLIEIYKKVPYNFKSLFQSFSKPLTIECKNCKNIWTVKSAKNLLIHSTLPEGAYPCEICNLRRKLNSKVLNLSKYIDTNEFFIVPPNNQRKNFSVICKVCGKQSVINYKKILEEKIQYRCKNKNCKSLKI